MAHPIDTFIAPICHQQIEILFQDEHILLINKPSGLLSLSGKNPLNKDSVHLRLVQQFSEARLAHRLDFGTSGIMLVALNKEVNANLTKQFQQRSVVKKYQCVVTGHLLLEEGCIDIPIIKDEANFPLQKVCHQRGKHALSQYQVVERLFKPARTRLLFTPLTGRTHQLRVHCQEIGHPILGCDLYGTPESHAMAKRLLLHALSFEFDHPVYNERFKIHCPCPF
ncbi:MAG: tRNA pseudouridine32 synthase/23S rRNA pseudouridine746 synthase [Paraglaciecola sp.]|jgi:tRNA pseudouridine32 synthase/23S rRNA pseudouridine746 synthase